MLIFSLIVIGGLFILLHKTHKNYMKRIDTLEQALKEKNT